MYFLDQLRNSLLVWAITSLFGTFGFFSTIYFGIKTIQRKILKFSIIDNELITNKQSNYSKLHMTYDNNEIEKLTITKVTFWNGSFLTIDETDIIKSSPLCIMATNGKILESSVLSGADPSTNINISPINDNKISISFECLEKKEGGIIQIVHTGDSKSIDITRKIKGGKVKLIKSTHSIYQFIGLCIASFAFMLAFLTTYQSNHIIAAIAYIASIILVIMISVYLYIDIYRDFIPKNCKK